MKLNKKQQIYDLLEEKVEEEDQLKVNNGKIMKVKVWKKVNKKGE